MRERSREFKNTQVMAVTTPTKAMEMVVMEGSKVCKGMSVNVELTLLFKESTRKNAKILWFKEVVRVLQLIPLARSMGGLTSMYASSVPSSVIMTKIIEVGWS